MRRWLVGAGVALVGVALVGCTSSKGGSSAAKAPFDAAAGGSAGSAAGAAAPGARSADGSAAGGAARADAALPLDDGTAKIRLAQMTVDVRRGGVAAAADRAESIALDAGGEIDADDRTSGPQATASLELRVPPEALRSVLGQLSRLGHEASRQGSTTDVTEKVADVDSRVTSARESIARLRTLYADAAKVADVIAIESELNEREADLESLEAQQRALQRQTSMAAITLTLRTAAKASAEPQHASGFVGGLERGWDGFVAAAGWAATAVGILLPFLVLLAVLAVIGGVVWRRRPRPAPVPTPAE